MAFDGVIHRATGATLNERNYAANGRAVPNPLAALLTEAYVYSREHSQIVAARTWLPNPATPAIDSAALVTIVSVPQCHVPPHATALLVALRYDVETDECRGYHRLRMLGSISDIETATVKGSAPPAIDPLSFVPRTLTALLVQPLIDADLDDAGIDRAALDLVVQAHALDDSELLAVEYYRMSCSIYWVALD